MYWEKLPDGIVKDCLEVQEEDSREYLAKRYLESSEDTKLDIEAFFLSNGPSMVNESKLKYYKGIPTSEELAEWFSL